MIYLIDDNQNNQRLQLGITFVDDGTYDKYLISFDKIERRDSPVDISHLEFLKNAECILMHSTTEDWDKEKGFIKESNSNVVKIKEYISDFGDKIPLVMFTNNGIQYFDNHDLTDINPSLISSINKTIFYKNLKDFMDNYINTGMIELRILRWGKHFIVNEVRELSLILLDIFKLRLETDHVHITDLSDYKQYFDRFIKLSYPNISPQIIYNDLEDNVMSIQLFRDKINLIISSFVKHGENIHSWS